MPATHRHPASARRFLNVSTQTAKIRGVIESQAGRFPAGQDGEHKFSGGSVQDGESTTTTMAIGSGSSTGSAPLSPTSTQPKRRRRSRTPERTSPRSIRAALSCAQHAGRAIAKRGYNDDGGWSYVLGEDVTVEANDILGLHFLSVVEKETRIERNEALGGLVLNTHWELSFTPPDGDEEVLDLGWRAWPIVVERQRPLDRSVAAASTTSQTYFLLRLLQLPRVEEGADGDDGLRDRTRIDEQPVKRSHFNRQRPGRGRPSGGMRADPATLLTAAISKHYDRLGIPVGHRDAHSVRILKRAPTTASDLQELATKLANMGPSTEQLGDLG